MRRISESRVTGASWPLSRELYHREIPESLLQAFGDAMSMREAADYGLVYSRTELEPRQK